MTPAIVGKVHSPTRARMVAAMLMGAITFFPAFAPRIKSLKIPHQSVAPLIEWDTAVEEHFLDLGRD